MKKKFLTALLALVMALLLTACSCDHDWQEATCTTAKTCPTCGEVEGEALGHSWQEASCTTAKTCFTCGLTEGTALGHDWQEATTEAPKTCARCKLTEGERIITDSRFTTASTKFLYGTWVSEANMTAEMMGLPMGFPNGVDCVLTIEFSNDGRMNLKMALKDEDTFMKDMREFTMEYTYLTLEQQGISREDADAAIQQNYGMTMEEYVTESLKDFDPKDIFEDFEEAGVYFVKDNRIYSATSWNDAEFDDDAFTLTNGILTIDGITLEDGGKPLQWKKQDNSSVLM